MAVRFFDEQCGEWRPVVSRPRGVPSTVDVLRSAGRVPLMEQAARMDIVARMDPLARYPALRRLEQYERTMQRMHDMDRLVRQFGR